MAEVDDADETGTLPGRAIVVALALATVLIGGYVTTGMPGMDHGDPTGGNGSAPSMDHAAMPAIHLGPDAFAARLARPSAFVVNVHTPYAGEIEGTDEFIPYDQIADDDRLPADKDTEIVLYCRSGRMSALAADALVRGGYTDVVDLEGGMDAWETAGMPLPRR